MNPHITYPPLNRLATDSKFKMRSDQNFSSALIRSLEINCQKLNKITLCWNFVWEITLMGCFVFFVFCLGFLCTWIVFY